MTIDIISFNKDTQMHLENLKADYETYLEIMDELLTPINGSGLDVETLTKLYESKLVYLRNLRVKCFYGMNLKEHGYFKTEDLQLIMKAIQQTNENLHDLILLVVASRLARRRVS